MLGFLAPKVDFNISISPFASRETLPAPHKARRLEHQRERAEERSGLAAILTLNLYMSIPEHEVRRGRVSPCVNPRPLMQLFRTVFAWFRVQGVRGEGASVQGLGVRV